MLVPLLCLSLVTPRLQQSEEPQIVTTFEIASFVGVPRAEAQRVIEDRLSSGLYLRDPWTARKRGIHQRPISLGFYGIGGRDAWRAFTDERRAEFGTIGTPRHSVEGKLEWSWVRGWLDSQSTLTRTRAMEQLDPLQYVLRVERAVAGLVDSDRPSAAERVLELDAILQELPRFWKEARRSLVNPRRSFALSAISALRALEPWLSNAPAAFGDMLWDPTFELLFEQHLRRAVRSTEDFREWLEDTLVEMENYQGALDRLRWEGLASSTTGRSVDAEAMHARILAETAELLMTLAPDEVLPTTNRGELEDEIVRGSANGWQAARDLGLFEGDIAISLTPRWTAVRAGMTPPVYLANPSNSSIEVHQAIAPEDESHHPAIHPWRRTVAGQRVLGLRHGAIGEARLVSTYVRDRVGGERLWNRHSIGGLGLFATDWPLRVAPETNPLASDPELLRMSLECRIEEALLLLAAIELHALEVSLPRVAESLAHRGGISRDSAAHVAELVLRDPMSGMSFVAYEALLHWERTLRGEATPIEAIERIYSVLDEHPNALIDDLRQAFPSLE